MSKKHQNMTELKTLANETRVNKGEVSLPGSNHQPVIKHYTEAETTHSEWSGGYQL